MKKIFKIIIIQFLTIFLFANINVYADDIDEELDFDNQNITVSVDSSKPVINSKRYAVYDRMSETVIYGLDENKESAMASTTKIMTSIIVLENVENLNEIVTINKDAAMTYGSRLGLKQNDKLSVNDLLYGLMLRSGNDAAVALALHVSDSIEEFAKLMNGKAEELKLVHTHFVTPNGLDNPDHYSTAFELAKLTDYALKNSKFCEIVKSKFANITINGVNKQIKNTNELLFTSMDGIYGVKTGFTFNAGRCLISAIKKNNMDLIIVVLGADTRNDRANDSIKLMNYVLNHYYVEDIESKVYEQFKLWKEINLNRIFINKAQNKLNLSLNNIDIKKIVTNNDISIEINSLYYLDAPIKIGDKIGNLVVKKGDSIIEIIDIVSSVQVDKNNIWDYFNLFAKSICL